MDATLTLYNAQGQELANNRDTNRRDPFLDFTVPADGEYLVRVHDFLYGGSNEYFYRMSIGTGPHIDYIFPPSGTPGTKQTFAPGQARYELAGVWGYRNLQEPSGSLLSGAVADTTTTAVTVDDGTDVAVGQTVLIDSEQMLVKAISGNSLTVARGLNGTTAATHTDNTAVSILRWPAPVERATLINTSRIWTRAPAFEPFYVDVDLDTDVRTMLDAYRLPAL